MMTNRKSTLTTVVSYGRIGPDLRRQQKRAAHH